MDKLRHVDDGSTVYSFADQFLVVCPRCARCAMTSRVNEAARLVCSSCGHTKTRETLYIDRQHSYRDLYFALPLWLQTDCCGEILWAYNLEHLSYLESYVAAELRLRNTDEIGAIRNATMASRLPKWMTSAKNREAVLHGIRVLKEKAAS